MIRRDEDLSEPRRAGRFGDFYDPEAFGQFSEAIARTLGTARFLVAQTVFVALWVALNLMSFVRHWDPYPFILLNLAFSTQAAYAAPLILLAQNRQDDRDRAQAEVDREVNARTQADTEYLARELSSVRLTLADVVTADDLRQAVDRVGTALDDLAARIDALASGTTVAGETGHADGSTIGPAVETP
ncbi:MAG: DUF1003 domain-containing protein [Acidimicrobiales bacterium]|nr:DUF1003 domain-containing protein [Acidimicrobiales bacterium]